MKPKIAVIGGSLREQIVMDTLQKNGAYLSSFGTERPGNNEAPSPEAALRNAEALLLPVRSNRKDGMVEGTSEKCPIALSEEGLGSMKEGAVIYCGIASAPLRRMAEHTGHPLKEIMEEDAVAVPNALLTAEGTLAYIMEHSPRSLTELTVAIFGYGRVGKACATLLRSVGCRVVVFCRRGEDIRHGREKALDMRYYSGAPSILGKTDYLINTVPAKIIDGALLSALPPSGSILELASMPGGIDRKAAEEQGISVTALPGLPNRHAPVSAGNILAAYYLNALKPLLGGDSKCD